MTQRISHYTGCAKQDDSDVIRIDLMHGVFVQQCGECGAHTEICRDAPSEYARRVNLKVDLFKPSGKWAYTCDCSVFLDTGIADDDELLSLISRAQNQVRPACITDGSYHVCIRDVTDPEGKDDTYHWMYTRLIHAKEANKA